MRVSTQRLPPSIRRALWTLRLLLTFIVFQLTVPSLAFPALSTVTQTVLGPDGKPASGVVYIRITAACRNGVNYVGNNTVTVQFTGGNFSVALVPTDGCPTQGSNVGVPWVTGTQYVAGSRVTYAGLIYAAVSTIPANPSVVPGSVGTTGLWLLISPTYTVGWNLTNGPQWNEVWAIPSTGGPFAVDQVRISQPALTSVPVTGPPGILPPATGLANGNYCAIVANQVVTGWTNVSCPGSGGGGGAFSWSALISSGWSGMTAGNWSGLVL
jgi:hypothetical protein